MDQPKAHLPKNVLQTSHHDSSTPTSPAPPARDRRPSVLTFAPVQRTCSAHRAGRARASGPSKRLSGISYSTCYWLCLRCSSALARSRERQNVDGVTQRAARRNARVSLLPKFFGHDDRQWTRSRPRARARASERETVTSSREPGMVRPSVHTCFFARYEGDGFDVKFVGWFFWLSGWWYSCERILCRGGIKILVDTEIIDGVWIVTK